MRNLNEDTITQAVLARHAEMPNERHANAIRQPMVYLAGLTR